MKQSEYFAHIAADGRKQTILEHLRGTAALASDYAAAFGGAQQGMLAGLAHDIGKYSRDFQCRIRGDYKQVDHSTAGAWEMMQKGQPYAAICVAGHHGGLPDMGGRGDSGDAPTLMGRCRRASDGRIPDYSDYQEELVLPDASFPQYCGKDMLTDAFFTRMLYSCLVDADFLDTESFMSGQRQTAETNIDVLLQRLQQYISRWFPPKTTINQRRCEILNACLKQGASELPGCFTLTVPTGGGKTVASLAFALQHAKTYGKRRIIYVIPYTSIIEQTASVFREILGEEVVLEHHSGVSYDLGESASQAQIRLAQATENWDVPVVVTTSVRFFESLFSNRSSQCRKLHNLTNSVIIFDEAQMLPVPYLRPCVYAMSQLVAHYGASVVLCTATQPALGNVFEEFLPGQTIREICPAGIYEDTVFQRVRFRKAGKLCLDTLAECICREKQALCIVNTRKSAERLYSMLEGEGSFHLSTLMYPAHRRAVLEEIRRRLKNGDSCRVVSTSLIEAGVDVDFPVVYREKAGLDSMLQAAGRCNREGKRQAEDSLVTIFETEAGAPEMLAIPIGAGETVLRECEDIASQKAIHLYFQELLALKGEKQLDQKEILKLLQNGSFPFRTVAQNFRLIEQDTVTIYIPVKENFELLRQLQQGLHTKALYRKLGQYGVSVYQADFMELLRMGGVTQLDSGSAVLNDLALYDEKTGLRLMADSGQAYIV